MGILDGVQKGKRVKPRRTVLYGVHGWGKSTWASRWPKPLFIDVENGLADIDCESILCHRNVEAVWQVALELTSPDAEIDYKTIVIDSGDWIEKLIWEKLCVKHGKDSILDIPFGKGYKEASRLYAKLLETLDLVIAKGLHVLILAHSQVVKHEPPDGQSYDRYMPKMHEQVSSLLQEWADEVLFATYKTHVKNTDEGFGRTRAIAIGTGQRIIKTTERPSHLAKNRLGLPEEMTADFSEYQAFLKG